jgi:hypothetical protein
VRESALGDSGHFIPWNKEGIRGNKEVLFHGITLFLVIPSLFHILFQWNKLE